MSDLSFEDLKTMPTLTSAAVKGSAYQPADGFLAEQSKEAKVTSVGDRNQAAAGSSENQTGSDTI